MGYALGIQDPRDETTMDPNDIPIPRRPTNGTCARCGQTFAVKPTGAPRMFCSGACKQAAFQHRARLARPPKPPKLPKLPGDEHQRILMWRLLQDAKLVPLDTPLPPPRSQEPAMRCD